MKNEKVQENVENVIMQVKGIAKFPFYDEETAKFSLKLLITDDVLLKIEKEIEPIGEEISVGTLEHNGEEYNSINIKTGYTIPIFDLKGEQLNAEDEDWCIYDGAKIVLKVNFKKYEYKEKRGRSTMTKTGVTGYLMGAVIVEQGVPYQQETKFEDFDLDEEIQF